MLDERLQPAVIDALENAGDFRIAHADGRERAGPLHARAFAAVDLLDAERRKVILLRERRLQDAVAVAAPAFVERHQPLDEDDAVRGNEGANTAALLQPQLEGRLPICTRGEAHKQLPTPAGRHW